MHDVDGSKCPNFFAYGAKKTVMFHCDDFLKQIDRNKDKGCEWHEMDCYHWVMHEMPEKLNEKLLAWLQKTDVKKK